MNAEDRRCLLDLPMDIHYRLFGHLTTKDIVKLALMSNAWKEIVQQATAEVFIFRPKAIFSRHHEVRFILFSFSAEHHTRGLLDFLVISSVAEV